MQIQSGDDHWAHVLVGFSGPHQGGPDDHLIHIPIGAAEPTADAPGYIDYHEVDPTQGKHGAVLFEADGDTPRVLRIYGPAVITVPAGSPYERVGDRIRLKAGATPYAPPPQPTAEEAARTAGTGWQRQPGATP